MKKIYAAPRAEKMEFNYGNVVASGGVCRSGTKKVYTDSGVPNCDSTYIGSVDVWNSDNLG